MVVFLGYFFEFFHQSFSDGAAPMHRIHTQVDGAQYLDGLADQIHNTEFHPELAHHLSILTCHETEGGQLLVEGADSELLFAETYQK